VKKLKEKINKVKGSPNIPSMSRPINVSPLHPACGYHCKKCTDHIVYTQTEVRTLYCMAVEEEDPKESFQAHMKYLADPSMRSAEIPAKVCRRCGEKLVVYMLPPREAGELLRACRMTDAIGKELNNWARLGISMQQMITSVLFSELRQWWRNDLPCLRAALNTAWRAKISGISMLIFSNMFERCYAEEIAEADADANAEADAAEEAAIDEAVDEALHKDRSVVIPPIMIPVVKTHAKCATPTSPTFWDGVSEEMALKLCESSYYDWDVIDQAWFQEHKHLIA
jgi:hypothetical protein